MSALAAVMTGKGTGAISTILLFGDSASGILKKLFKPVSEKVPEFSVGKIYLGSFGSADSVIDQVTIGCEQQNCFAINCHGNPLIVELIMGLLNKNGAQLVTGENIMSEILTGQKIDNTIEIEARLIQPKIRTLTGSQIVSNQINSGLSLKAKKWLVVRAKELG